MISRTALHGSPLLLALYGGIRLIPGSRQPGPGWLAGHTALLAALLLLGVVFAGLGRLNAGTRWRIPVLAAAYAGLAASLVQVGIDLYVGARAADEARMAAMFGRIQAVPGVLPVVYQVVPLFVYLGLLALLLMAAFRKRLTFWSPALVFLGTSLMSDLDLMSAGALCYLLAFVPLATRRAVAGA